MCIHRVDLGEILKKSLRSLSESSKRLDREPSNVSSTGQSKSLSGMTEK